MAEKNPEIMDKIINLCKNRGFIFPGSEIYGGLANSWDYGPLGVELKNNIKRAWWKYFVQERDDMVGLDAAIFMNPKVWEASGHVGGFSDAMIDCKKCRGRFRADQLIEDQSKMKVEGKTPEEMSKIIKDEKIKCPVCGVSDFTEARKFNLMFKTYQGVLEDETDVIYLRPETAQGIFVNFKNVLSATRRKLPFGIAQIGKSFRNEITPGNFIFRTREFEQMEIEYFISPKSDWQVKFDELREAMWNFYKNFGIKENHLRWREHDPEELSHYSKKTADIEYNYPFGWKELNGLAYRTDFDLNQHQKFSGADLNYFDAESGEKFVPHCIEPSFGCDRALLVFLLDAYCEEEAPTGDGNMETRVVLKLHKDLAPIKIAVLPLSKKVELAGLSHQILETLKKNWLVDYDETQSIGKRYRRQDEIGTPYCVTVDFDSLNDQAVTVRDRDSMKQERIAIGDLVSYFKENI
ncbi:MAG: glycine--tRNA ligase [Patescibacteria group bacterium]